MGKPKKKSRWWVNIDHHVCILADGSNNRLPSLCQAILTSWRWLKSLRKFRMLKSWKKRWKAWLLRRLKMSGQPMWVSYQKKALKLCTLLIWNRKESMNGRKSADTSITSKRKLIDEQVSVSMNMRKRGQPPFKLRTKKVIDGNDSMARPWRGSWRYWWRFWLWMV